MPAVCFLSRSEMRYSVSSSARKSTLSLRHTQAQHHAAEIGGQGDLERKPRLAFLGAAGENREPDGDQAGNDER